MDTRLSSSEESCIAALDDAGLARHGDDQVGNRGYLRQFHREHLVRLPGYTYRSRRTRMDDKND